MEDLIKTSGWIEENLKVGIIQRDDSLILKGEYASRAEKIIKEMMSVLEKGGKLDEQKINYIADLSDRGDLVQGRKSGGRT